MKKLTLAAVTVSMMALTACSSFKKDYEVVDASLSSPPKWIEKPASVDTSKDAKKYRYFVDEGENAVQRLCEKSAKARADAKIAGEISQFITDTYAESSQAEGEMNEGYSEESLAKQVQAYVVGSQLAGSYWEKRDYQKKKGAADNKKVFHCYAVVRIDKETLAKATDASIKKFMTGVRNEQAKTRALQSLETAKQAFVDGE